MFKKLRTDLEEKSLRKKYKLAVVELLDKIQLGFHWTSKVDLDRQADIWMEIIYPQVPIEELNDCYLAASRDHEKKDNRAITHIDILREYRKRRLQSSVEIQVNIACQFCVAFQSGESPVPCRFHPPVMPDVDWAKVEIPFHTFKGTWCRGACGTCEKCKWLIDNGYEPKGVGQ